MDKRPSHETRFSDASSFDEICIKCGRTDETPGGWGLLVERLEGHVQSRLVRNTPEIKNGAWDMMLEAAQRIRTLSREVEKAEKACLEQRHRAQDEEASTIALQSQLNDAVGLLEGLLHVIDSAIPRVTTASGDEVPAYVTGSQIEARAFLSKHKPQPEKADG